ncbi:MAG TPA: hypothetical protein DGR97_04950, partial [Gammaproteobacteria bacterium]|nr:hypothetical protein [Gammaproteobacteria bacterium]
MDKAIYDIRLARLDETERLQTFIDEHWRRNHIFVKSKTLLDWQHLNNSADHYNFIVGIEITSGEIHGVLGFIPLSQFDASLPDESLCWMAIWKVCAAARGRKLGRHLMAYLTDCVKPGCISTVGATEMTLRMYADRGYQIGRMAQHFVLNPAIDKFSLINLNGMPRPTTAPKAVTPKKTLRRISENELHRSDVKLFDKQLAIPKKTPAYIINRYCRHPLYHYTIYHILQSGHVEGIIVTRTSEHRSVRAIRIVEFVGPDAAITGLGTEWLDLLVHENAEYIDFYSAGIPLEILNAAGFHHRQADSGIVVPNYFEPFSR